MLLTVNQKDSGIFVGMDKKICTSCGDPKLLEEYYSRGGKNRHSECKECSKKRVMNHSHTKDGLVSNIYSSQRTSSNRRGHLLPSYTNKELMAWMFFQKKFHVLYDEWVDSGFKTDLKPSCDRPDDYKSYTLDNLQLMTWGENKSKGHLDIKNGVNNKQLRAVVGISIVDNKEISFHSMRDADRQTGIDHSSISKCCNGKQKTAGGYKWKYIE